MLVELHQYFIQYKPQVYIFNGLKRGLKTREKAIRHALEHLCRYTHKIRISNHRILNISKTHVTFKYLDRKIGQSKIKTIPGKQFLAFFAEHILPKSFIKIRYFSFLSSRSKKKDLASARKSINVNPPTPLKDITTRGLIKLTTRKDPYTCNCCGIGEMVIIKIFPPIRGSPVKYGSEGYQSIEK